MKFENMLKAEFDKIETSKEQKNKLIENIKLKSSKEQIDAAVLRADRFKEEFDKIRTSKIQKSKLIKTIKIGLDKNKEQFGMAIASAKEKQEQEKQKQKLINENKKSWFGRNIKWLASSFAAAIFLAVIIPIISLIIRGGAEWQSYSSISIIQYAEALQDTAATLKNQSALKSSVQQLDATQFNAWQPYENDPNIISSVSLDEILDEINNSAPITFGMFSFEFCRLVLQSPKTDFLGKMTEPILMDINLGDYNNDWNCAIELKIERKEMIGTLACYSDNSVVTFNFRVLYNFETKTLTECEWTAMFSFQSVDSSNFTFLSAKYNNSSSIKSFEYKYNAEVAETVKTQSIAKFNEIKNAQKISFKYDMWIELMHAMEFTFN